MKESPEVAEELEAHMKINSITDGWGYGLELDMDCLRAEALERGANAVVGLRLTTSMIMQGTAEILAYGTGVVLEAE